MRRVIKYSVIGEIATNLKNQIDELKNRRNKLLLDVNKISEGYKGKDATIIINKYKTKIAEIDKFIENMEKYQICFDWLAGNYRYSHKKAESKMGNIISEEIVTQDLLTEAINIDNFIDGE